MCNQLAAQHSLCLSYLTLELCLKEEGISAVLLEVLWVTENSGHTPFLTLQKDMRGKNPQDL